MTLVIKYMRKAEIIQIIIKRRRFMKKFISLMLVICMVIVTPCIACATDSQEKEEPYILTWLKQIWAEKRAREKEAYDSYTDKMNWYGYNKLYDNESAESTETLNPDEVSKMVAGVLYCETDKNYAYSSYMGDVSVNESWLEFATHIPIYSAQDIVMGEKVSKLQIAKMLVQGIEIVYRKDVEITDKLDEKYRKDYDEKELELIDKAISLGILENSKNDLEKTNLVKGELNKMLIIVSEKYSMVYYNNRHASRPHAELVVDKDKLPKNASIYPYVVDNAPKEIYEIEMPKMLTSISKLPKEEYNIYRKGYFYTDVIISDYFNIVLNVDYRTINADQLIKDLSTLMGYDLEQVVSGKKIYREAVEKYVAYVKENEIVLSGKARPLLPIVYSDEALHFVRCKIEFKVVNSKTNKDLILWDKGITYNSNEISVYTDVATTLSSFSRSFKIYNGMSCMKYIVKDDNNSVTVKQSN